MNVISRPKISHKKTSNKVNQNKNLDLFYIFKS